MKVLGLLFITLSVFVLWATTPVSRMSGMPELLSFFGVYFGAVYIVLQIALVYHLKSVRGKWLVTGAFIAGSALGISGWGLDMWGAQSVHGLSVIRQALVSGSCASGVVLGMALVRGRV